MGLVRKNPRHTELSWIIVSPKELVSRRNQEGHFQGTMSNNQPCFFVRLQRETLCPSRKARELLKRVTTWFNAFISFDLGMGVKHSTMFTCQFRWHRSTPPALLPMAGALDPAVLLDPTVSSTAVEAARICFVEELKTSQKLEFISGNCRTKLYQS